MLTPPWQPQFPLCRRSLPRRVTLHAGGLRNGLRTVARANRTPRIRRERCVSGSRRWRPFHTFFSRHCWEGEIYARPFRRRLETSAKPPCAGDVIHSGHAGARLNSLSPSPTGGYGSTRRGGACPSLQLPAPDRAAALRPVRQRAVRWQRACFPLAGRRPLGGRSTR